jgi:hypothetical protein
MLACRPPVLNGFSHYFFQSFQRNTLEDLTLIGDTRWRCLLQQVASGFDFWRDNLDFSLTYSFLPHCGLGIDSASSTNKYQGYLLGGKGCQCVGLKTLPPSCADCLEIWETHPPGTLAACTGLYTFYLALIQGRNLPHYFQLISLNLLAVSNEP